VNENSSYKYKFKQMFKKIGQPKTVDPSDVILSMISVLVFSECLGLLLGPGPNNEVILICFDLFDIFVCKCVPL
jgi:hypothetical protein